jgi:hypothetical protein
MKISDTTPTQVLAEAFRSAGYDGIVYGSKLGRGKTVAVFDLSAAEVASCHLYRVEGVSLAYDMAAEPSIVEKYSNAVKTYDVKRIREERGW